VSEGHIAMERISSSFPVPRSLKPLPLSSVLSSISPASLASHLSTLRRDILTHYIEFSFDQPTSLTVSNVKDASGSLVHVLSRFPSPPNTTDHISPLANVSTTLDFLHKQLFPTLPPTHRQSFPRSLSKPISTAILARLLIPCLPSQLEALPTFLKLANKAVDLEDKYIVGMLDATSDREIKAWVNNVCAHYERRRRSCILDSTRKLIVQSTSSEPTFYAHLSLSQETPDQVAHTPSDEGDAWGLDDDGQSFKTGSSSSAVEPEVEDVWGFDDDLEEEITEKGQLAGPAEVKEDPEEAWGWNAEEPVPEEPAQEDNPWDDPWGDESTPAEATPAMRPTTVPSQRPSANSAPATQNIIGGKQPLVTNGHPTNTTNDPSRHPPKSKPITEPYLVSTLAKSIVRAVDDALREGKGLASSGIFPYSPTSTTMPGTLIMQSGALVLDLYRAVYPVVAAARLARPGDVMKFANDCFWLAEEVGRFVTYERGMLVVKDKLEECRGVLQVLADSWYQDGIVSP
jgi:protein transport protein DSL1/ZW10